MSSKNIDREEEQLRSLFRLLKNEEEKRTPDFLSVLNRSRNEQQQARRSLWKLAIALGSATIIILILLYRFELFQPRSPKQKLLQWESPTAILLQPPESQFLTTVPQLGKPLIRFDGTNPHNSTKDNL